MRDNGVSWSDLGNAVEHGGEGRYTEAEMVELAQAYRREGVEAGIKVGMARAGNGGRNGGVDLPKPFAMAEFCHDRLGQLKDDKQREFVADMFLMTQRGMSLSLGRLGYLASIYIQTGGRF